MLFLGLLLFLLGIRLMSYGLSKLWGSAFFTAVGRLTNNRITAFLCGLLFTALTQSSSLATVIVVGAADAGMLNVPAAIAVIAGANVGTTVTGQLISFQIHEFAAFFLGIGLLLFFLGGRRKRSAGSALAGLGILLYGLKFITAALAPLHEKTWFLSLLKASTAHPLLGMASGAILTTVVQSSSAVMGIVISLASEGIINLTSGTAVMIGADVGTCLTAILASMGGVTSAKRAAAAHLLFNLCSMAIIMLIYPFFIKAASMTAAALPHQLANAHTLYNLCGALLVLLFLHPFQKLVEKLVRVEYTEKKRISCLISELIRRWF